MGATTTIFKPLFLSKKKIQVRKSPILIDVNTESDKNANFLFDQDRKQIITFAF